MESPADFSDEEDLLWPPAPNVEPMITSIIDEDETDPGKGETKRLNRFTDGSTPWTDAWINDRAKGQDEINALVAKGHYTPCYLLLPRVNTPPPAPPAPPAPLAPLAPLASPTEVSSPNQVPSPAPASPPAPLVVLPAQTIHAPTVTAKVADCACCRDDSSNYEKALASPAQEKVRYFTENTWAPGNKFESPSGVDPRNLSLNRYTPPEGQFVPPSAGSNPFSGALYAPRFPPEPARPAPAQKTIDTRYLIDSHVSQPENPNSWDPSMQPRPGHKFWGNPFRHAPRPVSQTFRPPRNPPLRRQLPMDLPLRAPPIVFPDPAPPPPPPPPPSFVVATTNIPPIAAQEPPRKPVSPRLRIREAPATLDLRNLFLAQERVADAPLPTRKPLLPSPMPNTGQTGQFFSKLRAANVPFPTREPLTPSPMLGTGQTGRIFSAPKVPDVPFPTRGPLTPSPTPDTGSPWRIFSAIRAADVSFPTRELPTPSPMLETGSSGQIFPTPEAPRFVLEVSSPSTGETLPDSCGWITSTIGDDVKIVCKSCLVDKAVKKQSKVPDTCDIYWLNYYMENEPLELRPYHYRKTAMAMADRCKALRESEHGWEPTIDIAIREALEILSVFAERDASVGGSGMEE